MFYGAVSGMVASLGDPYSVFLDPEYAQKFTKELEGEFEGIGAEIGIKQERLTVIAPLPGTPADKAGIKAGDNVLAIDGVDDLDLNLSDFVARVNSDLVGKFVNLASRCAGFIEKRFEGRLADHLLELRFRQVRLPEDRARHRGSVRLLALVRRSVRHLIRTAIQLTRDGDRQVERRCEPAQKVLLRRTVRSVGVAHADCHFVGELP